MSSNIAKNFGQKLGGKSLSLHAYVRRQEENFCTFYVQKFCFFKKGSQHHREIGASGKKWTNILTHFFSSSEQKCQNYFTYLFGTLISAKAMLLLIFVSQSRQKRFTHEKTPPKIYFLSVKKIVSSTTCLHKYLLHGE